MQGGNLRVADLARWFDRQNSTVQGWLAGRKVSGPAAEVLSIWAEVNRLEALIRDRKGFPIPRLSATDRIAYLARIKGKAK